MKFPNTNNGLTDIHLDLMKELIQRALDKSAAAMEQMLKIRVRAGDIDFDNGPLRYMSEFDLLGRFKVHVVRVKFSGEVGGAFYFIINGHEVDLINRVCLPESVNASRTSENKMMKHGFMIEIENLIASLSITEISEFLGVQLLNGVPDVDVMQGSNVNYYLAEENLNNKTAFHVKSELKGVAVDITPTFIWMLDQSFVDTLRLNIVE